MLMDTYTNYDEKRVKNKNTEHTLMLGEPLLFFQSQAYHLYLYGDR